MRRFLATLGALSVLSVPGVVSQDTLDPNCMVQCTDSTNAAFSTYGCANAGDNSCLCTNEQYKLDARNCAQTTCGATEDQAEGYLSDTFCAGTPEPTDGALTTTGPAPTTDTAPTETSVPASTVSAESTEAPTTTTSDGAAGETAPAKGNEDDGQESTGGGGLSHGAAVGIGVGVAVCVVAVAVVAVALLLRNRKRKQQLGQSHGGPKPMPDAGRSMMSADHASFGEKRGGESIEMTTNRYEDMVPRQTPRTLV